MFTLQAGKQHGVAANPQVAMPLKAKANSSHDESHETYIPSLSPALTSRDRKSTREDIAEPAFVVTHALRSEGADASENGTDRGTPLVAAPITAAFAKHHGRTAGNNGRADNLVIAFSSKDHGADAGEIAPTLRSQNFGWNKSEASSTSNPAMAFTERTRAEGRTFEAQEELAYALTNPGSGGRTHSRQVAGHFGVRRLTPRECERLMGFPDDFTKWDAQGKEISDSARYRMLGNSIVVPVSQWIAERIVKVEKND